MAKRRRRNQSTAERPKVALLPLCEVIFASEVGWLSECFEIGVEYVVPIALCGCRRLLWRHDQVKDAKKYLSLNTDILKLCMDVPRHAISKTIQIFARMSLVKRLTICHSK